MKRILCYFVLFILFVMITVGESPAQNVPTSAQKTVKRAREDRERPERTLIKKRPVPARSNIKTSGYWIEAAVAFDDINKGTSVSHPIEIASAEQLAYLAKLVKSGDNCAGKHFKLVADIRLGGREWTPIGEYGTDDNDNARRFCGAFYGGGHQIEKMTITKNNDYVGLFGVCDTGAYIEKLQIVDCYVRGNMKVGGMVGELINGTVSDCTLSGNIIASNEYVGGIVGSNNGTVVNCRTSAVVFGNSNDTGGLAGVNGDRILGTVDNCKATGAVTGYWNVGGLIGRNNGTVNNSCASGNVIGEEWVGGLIGWTDNGTVTYCRASGNVQGFFDVGGLIGFNGYRKSTVLVKHSHATGKITGVGMGNYCIGGLAGYSGGTIASCYATGEINGEESVGGLIGEHGGKTIDSHATGNVQGSFDVGGLIGFNGFPQSQTAVENCCASGIVTGYEVYNYAIGGLIGYSGGNVSRCYSGGSTSGGDAVGGLIGEQAGVLTDSYASGAVTAKNTAGGLVGWNIAKIANCLAVGMVNCEGVGGGLIGRNQDRKAIVQNSYYDRQSTQQPKAIGLNNNNESDTLVKPLLTETLQNGSIPQGFEPALWETIQGQYPKPKDIRTNLQNP